MTSVRTVLAFVERAEHDAALMPGVQLDPGIGHTACLRARFRDQSRDDAPPTLECPLWDVRALIPFDLDEDVAAFRRELGPG